LGAATQLYGQSDQASKSFESTGGGPGTSDPGRWWRSNVTLLSLLVEAFHIQGHAVVGPDWMGSTRYEIVAKVPAGANRNDVPLMFHKLLTECFGLTFHREQKEMPAYALVTSRNGPKLKRSTDSPASVPGRSGFPAVP
jgi:uncharacterized protein (TIGR03435 family)